MYALNLIQMHVIKPLDPNTIKAVQHLIKLLYRQMSMDSETFHRNFILYLPDYKCELIESTKLIYDDKGYHKDIQYDLTTAKMQLSIQFFLYYVINLKRQNSMDSP